MADRTERIGLGTAQWGMGYGISNFKGQTTKHEVDEIIDFARAHGIQIIDTAAAYGEAEAVLGGQDLGNMRVITKTPHYSTKMIKSEHARNLRATFDRSLRLLRAKSIYGLLVHNADDLLLSGANWLIDELQSLRSAGKVKKIGVSVYDGEQVDAVLKLFTPDLVQLPLSIFDQRLINDGSIDRLSELGVEIQARSVFLQGLLLMKPELAPIYFDPWRDKLYAWQAACEKNNVLPHHAALAFVCDQPNVSCCIIGVQDNTQLKQSLNGLESASRIDVAEFSSTDLGLVNPVNWRLH